MEQNKKHKACHIVLFYEELQFPFLENNSTSFLQKLQEHMPTFGDGALTKLH